MTSYTNLEDANGEPVKISAGALRDEFDFPPFSVWDARSGQWQARKMKHLSLGIQSEVGRGANLLGMSDTVLQPDPKKRSKLAAMPGRKSNSNAGAYMVKGADGYKSSDSKYKKAKGADSGFHQTQELGAYPDNPEVAIKDFYSKLRKGMSREAIIAEYVAENNAGSSGTSIFDPVICELFYSWFVPKGGTILDPFAGGSVRGIMASELGRNYVGIDVRKEQIAANEAQAKKICKGPQPIWKLGDSRDIKKLVGMRRFDAIFSCPPYFDLEKYSDDPNDLSNMSYDAFLEGMGSIVEQCAAVLKPDRFACYVIADVRDKAGFYRGLVVDTILMFERAGLRLYNQAVLITAVGSLSIRAKRIFGPSRKLGNSHQHVLIFCGGDPKKAVAAITGGTK
jgi:hypothetical protein